jgi:DNA-binding beta-propeller fold protein YncE
VALAISGNRLYVADFLAGTVGVYDATTGQTINASLISVNSPSGLAILGNTLYVSDYVDKAVNAYDANTGTAIVGFSDPKSKRNCRRSRTDDRRVVRVYFASSHRPWWQAQSANVMGA